MKIICILLVFALSSILTQQPQSQIKDPQVFVAGGGSRKDGFDFTANVRKNVYESNNGKHAFDVTGGYSQHVGGPYGSSPADKRFGGIYTYRW